MAKRTTRKAPNGAQVIRRVLAAAVPRPRSESSKEDKNKYAIRFADKMGQEIASALARHLPGTECSPKRKSQSLRNAKQLDVNFSSPEMGLALGLSLKSVHIREGTGSRRYTHNKKRNEEELRIEASGYHKRQPYAVMIGVLFLPIDSCDDAKKNNSSSFGSWVRHLRPYSGRSGPHDDADRFEKLYIALYEPDGSDLRFFDVESAPPKAGRPSNSLEFNEFIDACHETYNSRNSLDFTWDDGSEPVPNDESDESESGQ